MGVNKTKKTENNDGIGQTLVSGALDRTKSIRNTAADIFEHLGLKNIKKTAKQLNVSPDCSSCFPHFPVDSAQNPLSPRTNGWEPN